MVRLIMGEKGTGKTKKLIELINASAAEENGNVVCIEAKSTMTFDIHYHVRLISADEYQITTYEGLRGDCNQAADDFLDWLNRFSNNHGVKFTVSVSGDPGLATDGMQKYL